MDDTVEAKKTYKVFAIMPFSEAFNKVWQMIEGVISSLNESRYDYQLSLSRADHEIHGDIVVESVM